MADEVHRIIVQALGEEELQTLQSAVDASKKALADAVATASKFGPAFAQSSPAVRQAAIELKQFEDSLKQSQRTLASSGVEVKGLSSSLTTLGFVANDVDQFNVSFAAGIRSISNNIPQLTYAAQNLASVGFKGILTALTGPAGIIIGFSALASLLPLIQVGWGKLEDAWSGGATETEAERMDKLAKATARTADETDRLNKFKREESAKGRLEQAEPAVVGKTRKIIEDAIVESGFGSAAEGLVKARNPQGLEGRIGSEDRKRLDEQRRELEAITTGGVFGITGLRKATPEEIGIVQERTDKLEREILDRTRKAEIETARKDISKAVANPLQAVGLVREFRQGGLNDLADRIKSGLEFERDKEDIKAQEEINEEDQKESDRRLKKRKEQLKETRELEVKELDDYIRQDEIENERRLRISEQRKKEFQKEYEQEQKEIGKASGLDILAKQAALGGASVVEISEYFRRTSGVDTVTAAEFAVGGSQAAQRELIEKQLNPKLRPSEIVSDIHSSIQQGIGDKEESERQQQHLEVAREMRNALVSINQNTKRDYAGHPIQTRRFF